MEASTAPFSTAKIPGVLKAAGWIWADNHNWDLYNCYALFRKQFTVRRHPGIVWLAITADQSYQLYINGQFVCRGPARGFQTHWPYDEVEIGQWLVRGNNVIAVRAYHPGVSNFQYISHGFAGLLAGFEIEGTQIVSDCSWRCRRQTGVTRGTVPSSLQLFPQEHIDARVEDPDWMLPNFDDNDWPEVKYSKPWDSVPWTSLEERGIPLLEEKALEPADLLGIQHGRSALGCSMTRDVVALRVSEGWNFDAAERATSLLEVPAGGSEDFTSYLLDFRHTIVGCLELATEMASGEEMIDSLHCETLSEGVVPDVVMGTHCRMAFGNRLICRSGPNRHRFYHPTGFRYLVITVRGAMKPMSLSYKLWSVGYPFEIRGAFHSSHANLEKLWDVCAWTQRCCSLDAYVDTPWREQAQWWGDARVQGWNTFYMDGDTRLLRRGIHCIASQKTADGLTYGHAPTIAHECVLPDFTLIWMLTIWDFYWQTGSTEPFLTHLDTISNALQYFENHLDETTGMLAHDPRYWLFLDWCDIFKEGYPSVYNLWFLFTLQKLEELARLTGEDQMRERVATVAAKLREALLGLIDGEGLCRDGLTWGRKLVSSASVHSQTLAMMTGLAPNKEQTMINRRLLPLLRGERFKAMPTPYWMAFIYAELIQRGHEIEVIDSIRKLWQPMVDHGTTWEVFQPKRGEESFSHAWSAHPLYLLMNTLGGIRQTAVGWKQIDFKPVFLGDYGGARIPSPEGCIESRWERKGAAIEVSLKIPDGVQARIFLPGIAGLRITSSQSWSIELKE